MPSSLYGLRCPKRFLILIDRALHQQSPILIGRVLHQLSPILIGGVLLVTEGPSVEYRLGCGAASVSRETIESEVEFFYL